MGTSIQGDWARAMTQEGAGCSSNTTCRRAQSETCKCHVQGACCWCIPLQLTCMLVPNPLDHDLCILWYYSFHPLELALYLHLCWLPSVTKVLVGVQSSTSACTDALPYYACTRQLIQIKHERLTGMTCPRCLLQSY